MNNDIMEKKKLNNFNNFNLISIINKDEDIAIDTKNNKSKKIIYGFLIILLIHILFFIYLIIFDKRLEANQILNIQNNNNLLKLRNGLSKKTSMIQNLITIIDNLLKNIAKNSNSQFDELMSQKYYLHQFYFCQNQNLFNNSLIENSIKFVKANFNKVSFDMFVYKKDDVVSDYITKYGNWEAQETRSLYDSLLYYSKKKNISENDIFILDIGANIGWYSLFFAKIGFNVISFEPSKINYYILLKNFCLNQDISMTIINKGLDIIEKNSTLYHPLLNLGNAYIFGNISRINLSEYYAEEIRMNKLNSYLEYLKDKNLALIKLDIEGSEIKALKSGIDLIIKYHIPFIFMEFQPNLLKEKGTEPKAFLEMLENNGYKISEKDFLSRKFVSLDEILKKAITNIYIVYTKFLD